jgi:hypothetical protein
MLAAVIWSNICEELKFASLLFYLALLFNFEIDATETVQLICLTDLELSSTL